MEKFRIPDVEIHSIRRSFGNIRQDREAFRKRNDLTTWEDMMFHTIDATMPRKKRISGEKLIFEAELPQETRKPLSQLTRKGLKNRLKPVLDLIASVAENENVDARTIATYTLQLLASAIGDKKTANSCKELLTNGTFACTLNSMHFDKSVFLLDFLEIGKRKYTNMRKLCKTENIIFPSYNRIADYRANIVLSSEIIDIQNANAVNIGVGISYKSLLLQTTLSLLEIIPQFPNSRYPLTVKISDGLDGSGSHKIYNQFEGIPHFNTKNYILFAFKMLSIIDSSDNTLWSNDAPNSPFSVRPVVLLAQKENEESFKFLMESMINSESATIEQEGLLLPQGIVKVIILRTMFDGKMSGILSGAGGAHCQLCTASFAELKDL